MFGSSTSHLQALEQAIIAVVTIDHHNNITFLIKPPKISGATAPKKCLEKMWLC